MCCFLFPCCMAYGVKKLFPFHYSIPSDACMPPKHDVTHVHACPTPPQAGRAAHTNGEQSDNPSQLKVPLCIFILYPHDLTCKYQRAPASTRGIVRPLTLFHSLHPFPHPPQPSILNASICCVCYYCHCDLFFQPNTCLWLNKPFIIITVIITHTLPVQLSWKCLSQSLGW